MAGRRWYIFSYIFVLNVVWGLYELPTSWILCVPALHNHRKMVANLLAVVTVLTPRKSDIEFQANTLTPGVQRGGFWLCQASRDGRLNLVDLEEYMVFFLTGKTNSQLDIVSFDSAIKLMYLSPGSEPAAAFESIRPPKNTRFKIDFPSGSNLWKMLILGAFAPSSIFSDSLIARPRNCIRVGMGLGVYCNVWMGGTGGTLCVGVCVCVEFLEA